MSHTTPHRLSLKLFTFNSLQFMATPIGAWRGERFRSVVNRLYLPFIRSGWPVPLSLVLDICSMLLNPGAMPSKWEHRATLPPEFQRLSSAYPLMLTRMRQHAVFDSMVHLIQGIGDPQRQEQALAAFLKFLVSGVGGFKNIYSFDTRDMRLEQFIISEKGIGYLTVDGDQKRSKGKSYFQGLKPLRDQPETHALHDLSLMLCQYFDTRPLEQIVTRDLQLVLEIAARTRSGTGRVDYRFLSWLLNRREIETVETLPPNPKVVEEYQPKAVKDIEGNTGGYVDVTKRKFRGNMAEVLPGEWATWDYPELMFDKMLNKGVMTYVRENFEFVENELRVLFCFVVDASSAMRLARNDAAHELGQGLTPYIRARALATLMVQDLSRYMPREDVHIDCGVYLWSPGTGEDLQTHATCAGVIDLFAWTREEASDRLTFLKRLTDQMPELFYARLTQEDAEARPELEPSPFEFIDLRHRNRHYHCRHVIFLSSTASLEGLISDAPSLGLDAHDGGMDSIHLVTCDVKHATVGLARVSSLEYGADFVDGVLPGRMSENRLRSQFVNLAILKGAGRPALELAADLWEEAL